MSSPISYPFPHGITQIDADYVAPGVASIYLIRQGDRLALIETGTVNSIPSVMSVIENQGLSADNVDWIIPTHIHLDHAAGAGELMHLCRNAKLVIHPRGASHMIDPSKLEAGTRAVYGDETYDKLYGKLRPIDADRVIQAPDNHEVDFNGRTLTFLDTPGHALHHFCIHDSASNSVFTGDTFGLSYRQFDTEDQVFLFVTTTPVHFDPEAMQSSINRLTELKPDYAYLTHYGPIEPTETNLTQLEESLRTFVEIAENELGKPEGRVDRMAQAISDWLWNKAQSIGSPVDEAFARKWLKTDSDLNAQGLDVWLRRREKAA